MPTTQGVYSDRVKYTLISQNFGSLEGATEILNWDTDDKTLARSKTLHGIFPTFSNDLTFTEDAALFVENAYRQGGINEKIIVIREERNPTSIDDEFVQTYRGELDLTKYKRDENGNITVRFNSGGIEKIRKARQNVKVELEAETTIDGEELPELELREVNLEGRDILLASEVRQEEDSLSYEMTAFSTFNPVGGSYTTKNRVANAHKADLIYESDDSVNAVIYNPIAVSTAMVGANDYINGTTGNMFYAVATDEADLELQIKVDAFISSANTQIPALTNPNVRLVLLTYENGVSYDFKSREVLQDFGDPRDFIGLNLQYEETINRNILTNESFALALELETNIIAGFSSITTLNYDLLEWRLRINEQSTSDSSRSNVILVHEAAERILKIITGEDDILYSTYYGGVDIGYEQDGAGRYTGLSHGYWVRQFQKGDNLYKSLTASWRDLFTSLEAVHNVGLGLEEFQGKERFVLEDKRYFYDNNVTIKLGQISNASRVVAEEYYFSDIEIGFGKGGDYEEVMGLDEYNVKAQFSTVITALENSYKQLSTFRGDSIAKEIARRKPKLNFPLEDTPYDRDVFIQDLKQGSAAVLEERKWQDDFEESPQGIFSPETATNLRYSPMNCFLRHAWFVAGGLQQYSEEFVRFASSEANSQLITKLQASLYPDYGGVARPENGNIKNGDIKNVRFFPERLTFDYEVGFETNQLLNGKTTLPNGKTIPNLYGLIEFINENGQIERGRLLKVKPNTGEWEILTGNF